MHMKRGTVIAAAATSSDEIYANGSALFRCAWRPMTANAHRIFCLSTNAGLIPEHSEAIVAQSVPRTRARRFQLWRNDRYDSMMRSSVMSAATSMTRVDST